MKKLISMVLACSMVFTMGINAFASNNTETTQISKTETVMVELENGKVIPVEVTEITTYQNKGRSSSDGDGNGDGVTSKVFHVKVTNEEMALIGVTANYIGKKVGVAAAGKIGKIVSESVGSKVESVVLNASDLEPIITSAVIASNVKHGVNGVEVYVGFIWDEIYYNAGGYWVDAWSYNYTRCYEF